MSACLFYSKFNKLYFLSEQFFRISFSCRDIGKKLKMCTFFSRLRLQRNRFWRGLLVYSMGSRNKHAYQNSDLYRLMFLFVENWSYLTGPISSQHQNVFFIFVVYLTLDMTDRLGLPMGGFWPLPPPRMYATVIGNNNQFHFFIT